MQPVKHVALIAGEESGDLHASVLVTQLKNAYPELILSGIGGKHMQAAGVTLVSDLAQYGITGLTEIIPHLRTIHKAFKTIKKHLNEQKPDLLILIDYPGFNLRLAQYAKKKLGLKILYYISPQIWAWKAKRIHVIKQCVDRMAVILPFEKVLYENAGVPVNFVGHPLVEKIALTKDTMSCRKELQLPLNKKLIALLPGSRGHEIERHMPVLINTAQLLLKQDPNFHFIIPRASTISAEKMNYYLSKHKLPITLTQGKALECMSAAHFVIVASGTASLESALLEKPMCIIYKSSLLTYHVAMSLIKVKFLGLCNLLVNKMMVPEFLHYDCNSLELSQYILEFFQNSEKSTTMMKQLSALKHSLSTNESDCSLFDLVVKELI